MCAPFSKLPANLRAAAVFILLTLTRPRPCSNLNSVMVTKRRKNTTSYFRLFYT